MTFSYTPNEKLCRRMANLWRMKMDRPKFDQLGTGTARERGCSPKEAFAESMCQTIVDRVTSGTTTAQLDVFEDKLVEILMAEYPLKAYAENHEKMQDSTRDYLSRMQWVWDLRVDYDPCWALSAALERAGLNKMQAPIKSRTGVSISDDMLYVNASFGYGASSEFHYPMDVDCSRWLVTSLYGSKEDVGSLVVMATHSPDEFRIEATEQRPQGQKDTE